ncbi:MAG: 4Fe-4S dicluster domain-containing protein [Candidatus Bathycorpusculaceae bacterium]
MPSPRIWKKLKVENVQMLWRGLKVMPKVKVDWSKCNGDGVCVEVCPVNVFELKKLPEYPDTQKSVPVRESDCIACMACVTSCPTQAITVEE